MAEVLGWLEMQSRRLIACAHCFIRNSFRTEVVNNLLVYIIPFPS